ncbi:MAG: alpha/beta hydrolase [Cellvibrionales bacterium]|nr:MAG: alpha/beta hydrolase [Cellvibrionales bacterium]
MKSLEQRISAAGHNINTLLLGCVDTKKPTLLFIHGGLDCIGMWRKFPRQLCEASGLAGIVYDRWGHGKSDPLVLPRPGDPREDEAGQPISDIIQHFALNKVILVGHSFGGAVALIAASKHPENICGIISIVPQLIMHEDAKSGLKLAEDAFYKGRLREKLLPFHADKTDTLFKNWASMALKKTVPEKPYATSLEEITCPVLAVFGEQDNYGFEPNLALMTERMGGPLEVFKMAEAAHYPHLETPEVLIKKTCQFIAALSLPL